jgi:GR25 family glycosyltransferase involved in LPS biosynthesis
LPGRTDRRDAIVLSAALSDIDLEVVDGIYGDTIKDKTVPLGPGKMTASEKGCWRSHMNIIEEFVFSVSLQI